MQIFVDMDDVLADFDRHHETVFGVRPDKTVDNVNWDEIRAQKNFYRNIPAMPDMYELWSYVKSVCYQFDTEPFVLTGIPSNVEEAEKNKRDWVKYMLGPHVPVICCLSKNKCLHGKPGDILIDDWEKHKTAWEDMGGLWITHTSAKTTIQQLNRVLNIKDSA